MLLYLINLISVKSIFLYLQIYLTLIVQGSTYMAFFLLLIIGRPIKLNILLLIIDIFDLGLWLHIRIASEKSANKLESKINV